MKIILIHYSYYEASGPEKYLFNITRLLVQEGHEVIPFSIHYSENIITNSKYLYSVFNQRIQKMLISI